MPMLHFSRIFQNIASEDDTHRATILVFWPVSNKIIFIFETFSAEIRQDISKIQFEI